MRVSFMLGAAAAGVVIAVVGGFLLDLSFQRAALLAPVLVVGAAAVIGLALIWTRAARESLRRRS